MHRPSGRSRPVRTTSTPAPAVLALLTALLVVTGCQSSTDPGPTVLPDAGPQTSAATAPVPQAPSETAEETSEQPVEEAEAVEDSAAGSSPDASGGVDDVLMCSGETFDEAQSRCPAAEDLVQTSALHCSGSITAEQAGDVRVVFARDGDPIQTLEVPLSEDAVGQTVPFDADTSVGELAVPSGQWSCEVTLPGGATGSASAQVEGPAEDFSQARSCSTEDTLVTDVLTHCLTNENELSSDLVSITCSALLTDVEGLDITVSLELDGQPRPVGTVTAPLGMIVAHINVEPIAFGGTTFPPGDYACVFETGSDASGRHSFTVVE